MDDLPCPSTRVFSVYASTSSDLRTDYNTLYLSVCLCVCGQVRRRLTAHEIDIKDLEAAVRGQGQESPREEIARLRRLRVEPDHYDVDIGGEVSQLL